MKPADPAALVDVDRYPLEDLDSPVSQAMLASCRYELEEQSICVLEGFLNPRGRWPAWCGKPPR